MTTMVQKARRLVEEFIRDLRSTSRMLRKNPGFAAITILTLALGIGASTTVYGWIDAILLHPLPGVAKVDELVAFEGVASNGEPVTTSYADFQHFRDNAKLIAGPAMARQTAFNVGEKERAQRVWGQFVSGNYFDVLQVKAAIGRTFLPEEQGDGLAVAPVVVISDRFWRSYFNADPGISGKTVRIANRELTVIGVTAPEFKGSVFGMTVDLWVPLSIRPLMIGFKTDWQLKDRGFRDLIGIARLKPGVTPPQAQAEVAQLARQLGETYPNSNKSIGATVLPLWKAHFGPQGLLTAPLQILMAACGVLLLIVCANVANLLLARQESRRGEFTLQLALGVTRARLVRQLLTESLLLALAGTVLGVLVANASGSLLAYLLPGGEGPALQDLRPNLRVMGFVAVLCVAVSFLTGVAPAMRSIRSNLSEGLKEGGRSKIGDGAGRRLRTLLVVGEVSLAVVTLVVAGLFAQGFRAAQRIQPGFDPSDVIVTQFHSTSSYNIADRIQFSQRLRENLESQPGVTAVAYSDAIPLGFQPSGWEELEIKGYASVPGENMRMHRNVVSPGYFQLMKIPMLEGRDFSDLDISGKPNVMIVNETFAKRFLGQGTVIGREVRGWGRWFTVVGLVKDSKNNYLTESPTPFFYVPIRQIYRADMTLAVYVRSSRNATQTTAVVRQAVREVDPNVVSFDIVPLAENISDSLSPQKVAASLLNGLGVLALLLTAVGLYSVMSYSVAQRTREIGVRMALGAQRGSVLVAVLREGMVMTVKGLVVGTIFAIFLSREAARLPVAGMTMGGAGNLLGSSATDPLVYVGAALLLCAIAAIANYIPAWRATRIDPLVALRYD